MYKYVDVSGFGHSGKSVMIDLFKEIDGFQVPNYFFEFDLVRIPGGLVDLKYNVSDNWSPIRSDAAIKRFMNVAYRMGLISSMSNPTSKVKAYGTQYEKFFKGLFSAETAKYIQSLIYSKSIRNDWPFLRIDESYFNILLDKVFKKMKLDKYFVNKYLTEYYFVLSEGFIEKTQQYLDTLFASTVENDAVHSIVLNNTFEPYNPQHSIDLFPNAKCVIVQRDPRDIFASTMMPTTGFIPDFLKSSMHWRIKKGFLMVDQLDSFISNQLITYQSVQKTDDKRILRLRYEDIVLRYDETLQQIFNFLEIDSSAHVRKKQSFDPDKSKLNIGLWKQLEDQQPIDRIYEKLSAYCYE